jgi:hypothetical protein
MQKSKAHSVPTVALIHDDGDNGYDSGATNNDEKTNDDGDRDPRLILSREGFPACPLTRLLTDSFVSHSVQSNIDGTGMRQCRA